MFSSTSCGLGLSTWYLAGLVWILTEGDPETRIQVQELCLGGAPRELRRGSKTGKTKKLIIDPFSNRLPLWENWSLICWGILGESSVQSLSGVWLFETPWTAACQASLSITNSQSLPKLMSIQSVMPSNHLILCHPLLLLPSIFPSIQVFSSESVLCIRWPKYWSFSFSISPSNDEKKSLFMWKIQCLGGTNMRSWE